jgi:hypothetical protein
MAETFGDVLTRVTIEQRLRDVWRWIPADLLDVDLDGFLDAVVTTASPDDPRIVVPRSSGRLLVCKDLTPG